MHFTAVWQCGKTNSYVLDLKHKNQDWKALLSFARKNWVLKMVINNTSYHHANHTEGNVWISSIAVHRYQTERVALRADQPLARGQKTDTRVPNILYKCNPLILFFGSFSLLRFCLFNKQKKPSYISFFHLTNFKKVTTYTFIQAYTYIWDS